MAQYLRTCAALPEDLSVAASTHIKQLISHVIPAPWDLTPSSGLFQQVHTCSIQSRRHINLKIHLYTLNFLNIRSIKHVFRTLSL